jgi:hypothetical protein
LNFYNKIIKNIRNSSDSKIILFRSIAIVVLFALMIYMVYVAPIGTEKLFCLILFVIFWYSKANYFWFAFFLIISAFPAGLFSETSASAIRRLPIFSPMPKVSFSVMDIFLILALLKAIIKGKKVNYRDILKLKNIFFIFPYIIIVSFFHGLTIKLFLNSTLRGLFFYSLIYSFPALIYDRKEVYKFMLMFFPFVFIEFMTQIYSINADDKFANIFNPGVMENVYNSVTGEIRAIPDGFLTVRLAYIFAFVMLECKEKFIPKYYSIIIILVSLTTALLSATRSAIVMFILIFIFYFLLVVKKKPNIFMQLFITIIIMITILDFANVINLNDFLGSSYKRFIGMVSIQEGSVQTEDTFDYRINTRLPILIEAISNSPFIGYGLSDKYYLYCDSHLGGLPIGLLQAGFIGYSLYIFFIVSIFKKCFRYIKKIPVNNSYISTTKVFIICFFGYLIINFTVDPVYVLNTSAIPQDILIHLIIASLFIYFAIREQALKKLELKNVKVN